MEEAADRIRKAVENKERIGIFGDFDVDGVSSAALLVRFLREAGYDPACRLPNRQSEGYGLSVRSVDDLYEEGVRLLITVDCGITAHEEIRYAETRGMKTIVTDHHQPQETLPEAVAVVDPKRADSSYPYPDLAGVGIAYKLAGALAAKGIGHGEDLRRYLDLVAVGTIADVAPMTGENRILVHHGLRELAVTGNPGLRALLSVAGFERRSVDYASVAFGLGPRINAAGRLGDADPAFQLLTTDSAEKAEELSRHLDKKNKMRKELDRRILEEALVKIGKLPEEPGGLVLASDSWHTGVIGIVASRLKEKTGGPAVLIAVKDGVGRGSARSVPGFPLHEAFEKCSDLLIRHGGHALAAGLTVREEKIDDFRSRFKELFEEARKNVPPRGSMELDAEIPLAACDRRFLADLGRLGPFGPGNRKPVFLGTNLAVPGGFNPVGKNHLKFRARSGEKTIDAIAFQAGHEKAGQWVEVDRFDLAFQLEENRWGGENRLQLNVKGIRPADPMI